MSDDNKPLNTVEISKYSLDKWHYKISPHTLETYRNRGGGPEYFQIGVNVLYWPAKYDEWILARTTPNVRSASEARQIRLARRELIGDESKKRKPDHSKPKKRAPRIDKSKPDKP
jgi:hypothetical protein